MKRPSGNSVGLATILLSASLCMWHSPASGEVVVVPGTAEWTTSTPVTAGSYVSISAAGLWSNQNDLKDWVGGPSGASLNRSDTFYLQSAPKFGLLGEFAGGSPFYIGSGWSGVAPSSGSLSFAMNDVPGEFANNWGSVTANVVTASPIGPPPPIPSRPPHTYAIVIGSHAPGTANILGIQVTNPDAVRGDLDADRVTAQLSSWASTFELKYDYSKSADTMATDIQNAIASISASIKPGDSLIFYYAGHGNGPSPGAMTTPTALVPVVGSSFAPQTLTADLSVSSLNGVKKTVILDCCHGGGFWNYGSGTGFGDHGLDTLQNIAIISASTSQSLAMGDSSGGFFTSSILPALTPDNTPSSLYSAASNAYERGDLVTGWMRDEGYGTAPWTPTSDFSSDYDPNQRLDGISVPEPTTVALVAFGGIGLLRRRR